jgi:hypothetical protein
MGVFGSGGGGGGGGNTNAFTPPLWAAAQFPDVTRAAGVLYGTPYQQYSGQQIAGINDTQATGMQYLADLSGNTSPDMAAMRRNLQVTAAGGFENPYASLTTMVGDNPWQFAEAAPQIGPNTYKGDTNPYGGFSPEYQAFKQNALNDTVGAYQRGTAAQTDSAFNRAGAFHGGGHDAQIAANEDALARNLARQSSEMDFGQWDRSSGLYNTDIGRNATLEGQDLNRTSDARLQDYARNSGIAENALNRGVQAQQADKSLASQYWDSERNRQLGAFEPILQANQFDQANARNLMGLGDIERGYTQDLLTQQQQNWMQQQNYPQTMLNNYLAALSQVSGNYGNTTQNYQMPNYQANPFAQALGGGLTAAGLYNAWGT